MKRGIALSAAIAAAFAATSTHADVLAAVPPCGAATQARVGSDYQSAALAIYRGELDGREVQGDTKHVLASTALARSLAAADTAGVTAAITKIVYHRQWHIVRLRVLASSGKLVADVGGPSVIAPVRGEISYRGTTVGSFVMSVQDDVGYAKLVSRYTGLPIELYDRSAPLVGELFPAAEVPPQLPAAGSSLTVNGARYLARVYGVNAFPSGRSEVLLAVPRAGTALSSSSCLTVDASVYTAVAEHLASRLVLPREAAVFVAVDRAFDLSKVTFVRVGSQIVASSVGVAAPQRLPVAGTIDYLGKRWLINSFVPVSGTRIYILYPEAALGGSTGSSGTTGAS